MSHLRRELGMLVALLLICTGLWASNSEFLSQSNVVNTTRQIAMLTTLAVGMAFVIITGGIDLSVGSVIGLTGVLLAKLASSEEGCYGMSLWIAIPIVLATAMMIGAVQGLLITRLNLQPFIVTLGFMMMLRGISQTIADNGSLSFGNSPLPRLANAGIFSYHGHPLLLYPVLICIVVVIAGAYVLHFTVFGRYIYAIGGNRDAAEYSGINVKRYETITYVISAGLASVAGISYAAYIGQMDQTVGQSFELYAIAAAVLGGCSLRGGEGTILGIVIGSSVLRIIYNGINMFQIRYKVPTGTRIFHLGPSWNDVIIGAVILIAVILDQVAHIVQAKRRTRKAGDPPPATTPPSEVIAAPTV